MRDSAPSIPVAERFAPPRWAAAVALSRGWLAKLSAEERVQVIAASLEAHDGCASHAARHLGVSRTQLWRHLRRHNMIGLPLEIAERATRPLRLVG
jgi:transcriptional regulator of acetoin/glycerol metabolism